MKDTGAPLPRRPRGSLSLILTVAWGALRRSPMVSLLIVLAVASGVAFQVPNAANLAGYQAEIVRQGLEESFGDVRVRPRRGRHFADGVALAGRARATPDVVAAVPVLTLAGAITYGDRTKETMVLGVDARAAVPHFPQVEGDVPALGDGKSIVVTRPLAERLGLARGHLVDLKIVLGPSGLDSLNVIASTMTVVGIADGSFVSPEGVIVDRVFLASELGEPDAAGAILVHLREHAGAANWAARFAATHAGTEAVAWNEDVPFLDSALRGSRAVATLSRVMGVTAVLIPVWSLLHVNVLYRRRESALLRALGFRRWALVLMHLVQVLMTAIPGIALGAIAATGLCLFFESHPIFATGSFVIRPLWGLTVFVWPIAIVLATTLLAALLPAAILARVDAAGVLRGHE